MASRIGFDNIPGEAGPNHQQFGRAHTAVRMLMATAKPPTEGEWQISTLSKSLCQIKCSQTRLENMQQRVGLRGRSCGPNQTAVLDDLGLLSQTSTASSAPSASARSLSSDSLSARTSGASSSTTVRRLCFYVLCLAASVPTVFSRYSPCDSLLMASVPLCPMRPRACSRR